MEKYCSLSGKQQFQTRTDALQAAQNMQNRGKGTPSVYLCDYCHHYHLTHYTYSRSKDIRSNLDPYFGKPKKKPRDMKIVIDNAYVTDGAMVSVKQLDDGGHHLHLALFDVEDKSLSVDFTYEQGLELIEAIKMQLGKMQPKY